MRIRSYTSGEQLGVYDSPKSRRFWKRYAHRRDRQEARRDPENAPRKRRYAGYYD